jgi:ABC-type branched-subunit amino acid transport system ATPase component
MGDSAANTPMLSIRDLTLRFGGVLALNEVSFDVHDAEICGLIGPNGAGKSSLFNCISRLYEPTKGDIRVEGKRLLEVENSKARRSAVRSRCAPLNSSSLHSCVEYLRMPASQ